MQLKMTKLEKAKAVLNLATEWDINALARELGRAKASISDLPGRREISQARWSSLTEVKKVTRRIHS